LDTVRLALQCLHDKVDTVRLALQCLIVTKYGSYKIIILIAHEHNQRPGRLALTWNFRILSSCSFVGSALLLWATGVAATAVVLAGT
jgi:hypothetical protein